VAVAAVTVVAAVVAVAVGANTAVVADATAISSWFPAGRGPASPGPALFFSLRPSPVLEDVAAVPDRPPYAP
jgi:hypothetical protein